MKSVKKLMIIFCILNFLVFALGCGWQSNLLGNKKSNSSTYNTTNGNPPLTPFNIQIEKGSLTGGCVVLQDDLTSNNEICFDVVFSRVPVLFDSTDITLIQPGTHATLAVAPTLDPLKYTVKIQNYLLNGSEDGLYSISVSAGSTIDQFGNFNLASSSSDNSVEFSQYLVRALGTIATSGGVLSADSCQGLNFQVWSDNNLTSLNTFFGGAPGVPPSGAINSGLIDNLLNLDHLEFQPSPDNYAMRWTGFLEIKIAGNYLFRTSSDDGSRFFVNGVMVVDNDGLHGNQTVTSSNVNLSVGRHSVELQFFERGGGNNIDTVYSGPDTAGLFVSPQSEVFQPASCPIPTSIDKSMISSYWIGLSPYTSGLIGIVRDDAITKHIKVSIDNQDLLKINSGSQLQGSTTLTSNNSKVMAAHNGASLLIVNNIGPTSLGDAWTIMSRIWRLECTTGNDLITFQIPTSSLNPNVDGIIFSSDSSFILNVRSFRLTEIGLQKAIAFRCSDLTSNLQYFSFGKYNL